MGAMRRGSVICWLLLIGFLLLGVDGCEEFEFAYFMAFGEEWADARDVNPQTTSGAVNNAKQALGVSSTGDPAADAATDPGDYLFNTMRAEELAKEGVENGDLSKVDEAIKLKPTDLGYRNARGAILASQGNASEAGTEFNVLDTIAAGRDRDSGGGTAIRESVLRDRMQWLRDVQDNGSGEVAKQYCDAAKKYRDLTGDDIYGRGRCW